MSLMTLSNEEKKAEYDFQLDHPKTFYQSGAQTGTGVLTIINFTVGVLT